MAMGLHTFPNSNNINNDGDDNDDDHDSQLLKL